MSRHSNKPKYKLDIKKIQEESSSAKPKRTEDTWSESDLYKEMLRSKSRRCH